MKITNMLTLSTAHITKETADKLNHDCEPIAPEDYNLHSFCWELGISCYSKSIYGWFLWIDRANHEAAPEDLRLCMKFALDNGCEWLCLDCDGLVEDSLPTYEWEE